MVDQVQAPAPVNKGGFFQSIGDFFTKDIPAGFHVVKNDVVHVAGVVGKFVAGGVVPFILANEVPAFQQYFHSTGVTGLNVPGIVLVGVSSLVSGLIGIAGKAPANSMTGQLVTEITPAVQAEIVQKVTAVVTPTVQSVVNQAVAAAQPATTK